MKTADGVEIVEGMLVWPLYGLLDDVDDVDADGSIVRFAVFDPYTGDTHIHGDEADLTTCYSSREAALEARQQGQA